MIRCHERRLPHREILEQPLFVTFRLHGSLPANRVFPSKQLNSGKAFVALDRLLDQACSGPLWLNHPQIAPFVLGALGAGDTQLRYDLHAFLVMPNHVHALVTPHVFADQWLGPLTRFTAHQSELIS